jgi:hypothetical protein
MALYYFHLRDGQDVLLDPEGEELSDMAAVAQRALAAARSILSTEVLQGRLPLDMHIDVEDASGAVVHRLGFPDAVEILPAKDHG